MNSKKKFSKEEMEKIIAECYTIADVCRKCGWVPMGGSYRTVKRYIKDYNIDTSHFTGQRTNIGNRLNKHNEKPVEYYLCKDSYIRTATLKKKLIESGLKENKCECCGVSEWQGKPLIMQLHHINGNDTDNRLENLQMLCPNCHSQTDNFCGKNYPYRKKRAYCKICGKELKDYRSLYCQECAAKLRGEAERKVKRPSKEELLKLVKNNSFEKVGKKIGVSGKTITKWCKSYGLPWHRKDIINYNE